MKYATIPLLLSLALAGQAAWAADGLLLRIKQNNAQGASDYDLIYAKHGDFAVSPNTTQAHDDDLFVVGRDRDGKELFRTRVRNPGQLHGEAFDPQTKHIQYARDIVLPQAYMEVRVPGSQALDHVELLNAGAAQGTAKAAAVQPVLKRFERSQIDSLVGRMKTQTVTRAATTATLYETGPSSNRMDIVLIGDGYTSADMGKWAADAQKVANGLLADPLYNANKAGINIRRVDVVSNQSGVTEPNLGLYRDTALSMQVGCYGVDRIVCSDENKVFTAVDSVLGADAHDVIVAVANTTTYGGAGGDIATMTMHQQAIELALHEIGHTAFGLADEYDYGTCDESREPTEPDVTMQGTRSNAKWGSMIASSTQVPTPAGAYPLGTVGMYVGARYCPSGMYRPTEDSRMRTLGQPWFAVNERRANAVFASYYKPGGDGGNPSTVTVTGSLANHQWASLPASGAYSSTVGGNFQLKLTGPASGADFDLTLYKWNGSAWAAVAVSNGPTSVETINYNGSAGYYYFEVRSYSGAGNYSVSYTFPK